jgi:hypothetical protein
VADTFTLTSEDYELIVAFAGCSLDESPGSNWVQDAGGLPDFICRVARAIKRSGKTTSEAIAIAVSRMKVWASGKGVDKDTQAKAAAALAEWEEKRAKSHAKSGAKKAGHALAASVNFDVSDRDLLRAVAFTPKCEMHPVDVMLASSEKASALQQILAFAADKETGNQYGNVAYADTKNKKYPVDTAAHVRSAWSYINQAKNQGGYSPAELAAIKSKIKSAAKKFGIDISDNSGD